MTSVHAPETIAAHAVAKLDRGFTISTSTLASPRSGYVVALPDHEVEIANVEVFTRRDLQRIVARYVEDHRSALAWPNRFLGGWVENGSLFLDVVKIYADPDAALAAGRAARQVAIFHLDTQSTIYCTSV